MLGLLEGLNKQRVPRLGEKNTWKNMEKNNTSTSHFCLSSRMFFLTLEKRENSPHKTLMTLDSPYVFSFKDTVGLLCILLFQDSDAEVQTCRDLQPKTKTN